MIGLENGNILEESTEGEEVLTSTMNMSDNQMI